MKSKIYLLVFSILISVLSACSPEEKRASLDGLWIGKVLMQGKEMPFKFLIKEKNDSVVEATVINGAEKIVLDEIYRRNDSLHITMNVFDISIDVAIKNNTLSGTYTKHYLEDYTLPITFLKGNERFLPQNSQEQAADFDGKWEVTFIYEEEQDTSKAVGVFRQNGKQLTGTFLTPLGDYRYLSGIADGKQLKMSTFDGNHAFLFEATLQDDGSLKGDFYSGKSWHESWTAVRNPQAVLPNPDSLTYLKKGYDRIYFEFPDLEGKKYQYPNDSLKGKVVILQIFGTWCPNCMDETKFLTKWYKENKDQNVEIIGLAYESKDDFNYAKNRVEKMIKKWNVDYNFLIAGTSDKDAASQTLPMLNRVISFPTMIIINKNGEVAKIHTGFNGPGTGEYYEHFKEEFHQTMDSLLKQ